MTDHAYDRRNLNFSRTQREAGIADAIWEDRIEPMQSWLGILSVILVAAALIGVGMWSLSLFVPTDLF